RGRLEAPVCLVADAVDASPASLEVVHQLDDTRALLRFLALVIVVIELGVRIGLSRELERLRDVVITDAVAPGRLAQRTVLVDGLVHDVPAMNSSFVASNDGLDVIAHARQQRLAIGGVSLPPRTLA